MEQSHKASADRMGPFASPRMTGIFNLPRILIHDLIAFSIEILHYLTFQGGRRHAGTFWIFLYWSYFLLLLFVPNLFWAGRKPQGYSPEGENRVLLAFEKAGQVLTTTCVLIFDDLNFHGWSAWTWWLIGAFVLMGLYELWWIRYFRSKRTLADFYSGLLGIPLAGATLPVLAFFLLGIYGKILWLPAAAVILGIGHIGIHWEHWKRL